MQKQNSVLWAWSNCSKQITTVNIAAVVYGNVTELATHIQTYLEKSWEEKESFPLFGAVREKVWF